MKKIFITAMAGMLCILTSCNDNSTTATEKTSGQRNKNLEANHTVEKAFETGDASKVDSVISADFVDHTNQGDKKGVDSLKAMINMIHTNFKDMKMEKLHETADDEYVFSQMHYSGNSDGAMGMPKGPYSMNVVEVTKYKDGKAVEH